jgi:GT2 family glycosyltransferase
MSSPDLSIIVLTWNTALITEKCVNTIIKNLKGVKYQIIVADNGSTDNTSSVFSNRNDLTYFNTGSNLGFARGNNAALKYAHGQYLLFLNSDMEFLDSSLTKMLAFHKKNLEIGAIGPSFLNPDLSPQGSVFPPQTISNAFREFWLKKPSYSKYVPQGNTPLPVWSISGGAILIRKKLFDKIGGWDQRYFFYFEDLELCRQIWASGFQVYFYPTCQVLHRHGSSGKSLAPSATQWHRLIPSSKLYHGVLYHTFLNLVIWSGQKWQKLVLGLEK